MDIWIFLYFLIISLKFARGNLLASQLYEDLMGSYNKIVLPVRNSSDVLMIKFGASLIRIIDIDEKNQVFTTNLWLEIEWTDPKLSWDPDVYGGIRKLHIPSDQLWTPDIVLYNNAAGDPEISIFTDALVYYDGTISWKPPAIYKSFCAIDVTWFPYDEQACDMKFGMWTYTGNYVDMQQLPEENVTRAADEKGDETDYLERGMDLSYFYRSDEWELLNLTSRRYEVIYSTCCGPSKYVDIRYFFRLKRKTLFYTVNLVVPCALIAFLTTYVFYLPRQKLTFSISILVTLTVFFLVLIDLIPPTSLVIPLFGKYLMFTMVLVSLSITITVISVNFKFRRSSTHHMPNWVRSFFLRTLPKVLCMQRPVPPEDEATKSEKATRQMQWDLWEQKLPPPVVYNKYADENSPCLPRRIETQVQQQHRMHTQLILHVIRNVNYIAQRFKQMEEEDQIATDWMYLNMVIDRLFLIVFTITNIAGTVGIIFQAPTLYDSTPPMPIPLPTRPLGGDTRWGTFK